MDEENKEVEAVKTEETKAPAQESKGLSIAAMVLGIVSLALFCIWYISIPCAILAIIFGIVGRKKGGKGMATAGLILGIIAIAILILIIILVVAGVATFSSATLSLFSDLIANNIISY